MHRIALLAIFILPLAGAPIRVQVTTGGHPHDISFYALFENQSNLAVTVNPHPSAFRRNLRKSADVLVLYDLNDVTSEKEQQALRDFLESGGGLVVLHHALADNWQWKWWYQEVIGARYLMGQDGDLPRSQPKDKEILNARCVAAHPILEGVGNLRVNDEAYKGMWHSPKSQVLMETDNPNNDRPVVWIGPWQKSRVVAIQIGHGPGAHNDPAYRRLVRNAILWVAPN